MALERAKVRDNRILMMRMLFGLIHLYWKTSGPRGVGNLAGTTLLAANLAHNFDCDHRFGGLSPVSRAKANSMIPLIRISQDAHVSRDQREGTPTL